MDDDLDIPPYLDRRPKRATCAETQTDQKCLAVPPSPSQGEGLPPLISPGEERHSDQHKDGPQQNPTESAHCPVTEPTPQGLQYIIPGCEKDQSRKRGQLELF